MNLYDELTDPSKWQNSYGLTTDGQSVADGTKQPNGDTPNKADAVMSDRPSVGQP